MQDFELTITISADGETVVGEVAGMRGKRCANVAALLDRVGQELEHRHTAEHDAPEPVRLGTSTARTLQIGR